MALKKAGTTATPLRQIEPRDYARDSKGLNAQLADADPGVRRWAARDLAQFPESATAVCARLVVESDDSVRAVLFSAAAQLGGPQVVQAMVQLLRSEDAGLRNGAIEVLASLPDAVAPHIDCLLRDADSDVRIFTVNLMSELRHPQVPHWLAQVLNDESDVNVVGAALDVMAEIGGPEALAALHDVRRRFPDDPFVAFSADLAIQRIAPA